MHYTALKMGVLNRVCYCHSVYFPLYELLGLDELRWNLDTGEFQTNLRYADLTKSKEKTVILKALYPFFL